MEGPTPTIEPLTHDTHAQFFADLKSRIQTAQLRASVAVNRELVLLYWQIGRDILDRQQKEIWGAKVIDRLAADLKREFPDMKGFSPRNLKYMRCFAEVWAEEEFVQQVAAQLPWLHNCVRLDKVADLTSVCGTLGPPSITAGAGRFWSTQIEGDLHRRQGKAITNFNRALPPPQSDLAQEVTKDPYNFDFLMLGAEAHERDLERGLLEHLRKFLLELGVGFAFVGSQYPLTVGGEDFRIDLRFYHLKLRCYVVID
jgi:predicted nuclease of restriction endonuclease-like (RecB) superfamily